VPRAASSEWLWDATAGRDYTRVAEALRFVASRCNDQPRLAEVARHIGLSPFHMQRLFVRWAGVSPKQFLGYLTVGYAKQRLCDGATVLDAALDAGLSGPGRLHDLFVSVEGMTPGDYRRCGASLVIRHATQQTAYGTALVLVTERGLCGLRFLADGDADATEALATARREWPASRFVADPAAVAESLALLGAGNGALLLRGSRFQLKVWEALLAVPEALMGSYGGLAAALAAPRAARAVGTAVGANPVAVLIPCHRVLRGSGLVGGYRWGIERKLALLGREAARAG